MNADIAAYNRESSEPELCAALAERIQAALPDAESKVWHAHPVWFLDGNPIVGYATVAKGGVRLLFWSGQSFDEPGLRPEGSFKAAEARYADVADLDPDALDRWLAKSREFQWDYRSIRANRGVLQPRSDGLR